MKGYRIMLRSIDDVLKSGVTCPDGDLGKVEHVYFDILTWCVRYLIVDTAAWGYGEKIWVPTCCVRQIDFASNVIKLNHAQQNMLSSSSIDTQTPISHLQEVAIFAHYGYKPYWQQERFRGAPKRTGGRFGPPVADEPDANVRIASKTDLPNATVELMNTKHVGGFAIEASDGPIGHIRDFVFDDETWLIRYLTVDTRDWWQRESEVLLATESFNRIDSTAQTISTTLSRGAIKRSPTYLDAVPLSRMYKTQLHKP